jgi:hypothetical protein
MTFTTSFSDSMSYKAENEKIKVCPFGGVLAVMSGPHDQLEVAKVSYTAKGTITFHPSPAFL